MNAISIPPSIPPRERTTVRPARRAHERLPLEIEVDVRSEHNFFTGFSLNVSRGGIFVATHFVRPIGSLLELRFTLPGEDSPIDAIAQVRWIAEPRDAREDGVRGLGLEFVAITAVDVARIQDFIDSVREPLFYED